MAPADINTSAEMEMFVRVIEQGGFSAAARLSRMAPFAVYGTAAVVPMRSFDRQRLHVSRAWGSFGGWRV